MRAVRVLVIVLIFAGVLVSGCISTTGSTGGSSQTAESISGGQTANGTSSATAAVGTIEINGTFSGYLTAPIDSLDEIERFLNSTNVTLYTFMAEISGKSNASIEIPVLKLVPAFIPKGVNITINGREINGTTYIPYASRLPVSIQEGGSPGHVGTTAYLTVHPARNITFTARTSADELNNVTEKTLLKAGGMQFIVKVVKPNDYIFSVLCNGTEVSSGRLTVG